MKEKEDLKTILISVILEMTLVERRQLLAMWKEHKNEHLSEPVDTGTTES